MNALQVRRTGTTQRKVLSPAAVARITADLKSGRYNNTTRANEPAFMAPSANPKDYSLVGYQPSGTPAQCSRRTVVLILW